jgi:hypothetical protein
MTEHDDLLGNAQLIREAWVRWYDNFRPLGDHGELTTFEAGFRAALEVRPSLVVRGEEELADALLTLLTDAGQTFDDEQARALAKSLVLRRTVTVAPSLVAESREVLARYFFKRRTHLPDEDFDYLLERERRGRDGVPESIWAEADALLAPGGPVQLADATPEQAWDEGMQAGLRRADFEYGHALIQVVKTNPYDGFTRKETNE